MTKNLYMQSNLQYINGRFRPSLSGYVTEVQSPTSEASIGRIPNSSPSDCAIAVHSAKDALVHWQFAPRDYRISFVLKLVRLLEGDHDRLNLIATLDTGTPSNSLRKILSIWGTTSSSCPNFDDVTNAIQIYNYHCFCSPANNNRNDNIQLTDEAIGVIAAIISWKAPMTTLAEIIAPAILCGNTLVIKVSETAPMSAIHLAGLIDSAGFPRGVINFVTGTTKFG